MKAYRFILPVLILALPAFAHAATLSVIPSATSVNVGNIITARIVVNTAGTSVNEGDATLLFPKDILDVVSVSKSSSVFSLWVEEPSFSNGAGTVTFDGGIPNPGYTGSGTVITVTFHAKAAGNATLSLSDASVRANDGLGTDVLTSANGAQIVVNGAQPIPPPTPTTPAETKPTPTPAPVTPSGPNAVAGLTSSTHTDQGLWYTATDADFSWSLPDAATAVEIIVGDTPTTVPTVAYAPAITHKLVKDLSAGISYFNIRAKVGGTWGPISSYRIQIDAVPPSLNSPTFAYDLIAHDLVISNIVATDTESGIAKYEVSVDGATPTIVRPEELSNGTYRLHYKTNSNLLSAAFDANEMATDGTHSASLTVYDQAGNHTAATGAFSVPVALVDQTLFTLFGLPVTLIWFLVALLALAVVSLIAAGTAWWRLLSIKQSSRTKVTKREQVVHRALSMYRTDLERHLKKLDSASGTRALSDAEAELKGDLEENLDDLERYLKKEFKKFDI